MPSYRARQSERPTETSTVRLEDGKTNDIEDTAAMGVSCRTMLLLFLFFFTFFVLSSFQATKKRFLTMSMSGDVRLGGLISGCSLVCLSLTPFSLLSLYCWVVYGST